MKKFFRNIHKGARKQPRLFATGIAFIILAIFISQTQSQNFTLFERSFKDESNKSIQDSFVKHIVTPEPVKALYMTSCVAGTNNFRDKLVRLVESTELNSIVIDIKDYTGRISFAVSDTALADALSPNCRALDMKEFVASLHEKGIYVIGRITVFQDPYYAKKRPDIAVQKASDRTIWKDYKGLSFTDPGAREVWDYHVLLAREAYALGFDELNFDYIRFPSDGPMKDIYYPVSEKWIAANPQFGKAYVLKDFFAYLQNGLKDLKVPISADLFGMTTTNTDDLNIGQILEFAAPHFDYIAPMVYPSHYPKNFNGWKNPNAVVYDIVKFSMDKAVQRLIIASSTPSKMRPWLQDFDYGGNYDVEEVRAQIQAVYDAGLTSWMIWDASNKYTQEAYLPNVN